MSIAWMTHVWNHSKHSGSALLLMLAIADSANEEGEAWPGRAMLAQRIRKTESYTRELIETLIKSHELRRTHIGGHGQGDTHHYRITIKGRPASPKMLEENQGEARLPNKGRFRGGLGEVTTLKNHSDPLDPLLSDPPPPEGPSLSSAAKKSEREMPPTGQIDWLGKARELVGEETFSEVQAWASRKGITEPERIFAAAKSWRSMPAGKNGHKGNMQAAIDEWMSRQEGADGK